MAVATPGDVVQKLLEVVHGRGLERLGDTGYRSPRTLYLKHDGNFGVQKTSMMTEMQRKATLRKLRRTRSPLEVGLKTRYVVS